MEIFNIGPLELLFIFIIALIILGPEDMVKTGKQLSLWIKKFIRSPFWSSLVDTTQEIKNFPKKFIHDTGLEEDIKEISKVKSALPKDLIPKDMNIDLDGGSKKKTESKAAASTHSAQTKDKAEVITAVEEPPKNPEDASVSEEGSSSTFDEPTQAVTAEEGHSEAEKPLDKTSE